MSGVAHQRLLQERKAWRQDHPFGFVAKPRSLPDGSVDMLHWDCRILGKINSAWEGGVYPLELQFPEDYPLSPPKAKFPKGFFHPTYMIVERWEPSITVKQILMGISDLLCEPRFHDPAQVFAYLVHKKKGMGEYNRRVKEQARKYSNDNHSTITGTVPTVMDLTDRDADMHATTCLRGVHKSGGVHISLHIKMMA